MTQFLWIGCLESDEEFKNKAKKGYDLASAQVSQQNLVAGMENIGGIVFDSINGSVLPPYPKYEDKIIKSNQWSHKKNCFDISVGYRNYKYINRVNCKNAMFLAADNWIKDRYNGGKLIVFVYSMRSAPMATACRIKKRISDVEIYLIVTDLPQYMDLGQSKIKSLLKKFDWIYIKKMQKSFDGFILYAARMAEYLKIPKDKWILMEGSYDVTVDNLSENCERNASKRVVMYSGKLDKEYGLDMLLDSFMKSTNANIELWLTGGGNAEEHIIECTKRDKRIIFWGFLPQREDVINLQKKADLLLNMRLPSEPASSFSFPSKLFEYMASGIPVLSFHIDGIPNEYDQYLYFFNTKYSIMENIERVLLEKEESRIKKGSSAREFILKMKSKEVQCQKILNFVGEKCD